jgi:hypothetical protein
MNLLKVIDMMNHIHLEIQCLGFTSGDLMAQIFFGLIKWWIFPFVSLALRTSEISKIEPASS